jgi:serine/threonine kinase 16
MALFGVIRDTLYAVTSSCFPNPTINVNRRTFRVLKLLGEGGFSYVHLVKDTSTGLLYALKIIRCPFGSDSVKDAMKEVEMYRLFHHENIIKVIDTCVVQDKDSAKIVYIFLPYYERGNLQDAINEHNLNTTRFSEAEVLNLFRQICHAVRALHTYRLPSVPTSGLDYESGNGTTTMAAPQENAQAGSGNLVPFAHRDIKPGNVLLSDEGDKAILMDFGSLIRARIKIRNRAQALFQQDLAAERSTMPYRAPELFDVKTNTDLDEKVDIWSLGCTLYAMAYGKSPFEASTAEGGSIQLAAINAQVRFPEGDRYYSSELKDLITYMFVVEPKQRPDIHQVIARVDSLLGNDEV